LDQQKGTPFSYKDVGVSSHVNLPLGYNIDKYRTKLGTGQSSFAAAKVALQRWQMFDLEWLRVFPENAEICQGSEVAVVASHFGFHSVNLCRIVYVVDTGGSVNTFGFAYGTLLEHAESGEERFTVSWDQTDDSVWYEILALSKPRAALAGIGYPLSRVIQKNFGRTSLAAMMMAVQTVAG
jgi:uncharacterized protein (UPF0548 family)